ncbi:potassium channel family protein [Desulfococcus multivorans]|jgi:trk system potassium uptake protein TrkA|uniref:TrkA-N domain protein n=1 Tax=Desulfococcus multivorans DSM 2059 TaxID=1121405 RepID=S7U586_DESML|nr:TrkA family potassium uptake protein [Desulfococcus multivorans]AOY57633.1 TrkA1: trk system potassium NAD-binding peripheral membrane protein [Desulfococcus multivorans]AQV00040.1 potassium transporter TrkA [Desulfococcus multivorans]EPR44190.1 TrkA-N domain protein [Desulfococcus multivorans DSM 2059]MDX9818423.1 TrkA family potassium uptake protein [Desulfococcus multivorans]SJZ77546.1 trk system potassium uptake protein TrkA [Desulfococcus multivorans DSM 2059]
MKRFAVIGLGNFGFHAAKALFEDGNEVAAIDTDKARVQAVDPYATEAIVMDATDKEALKSLGLEEMDAVIVSTGTRISNSILICLYLQEIGVRKILAKAIDDDHGKILKRVGATQIIHPERDMALRVSRGLCRPNVLDFIPLSDEYDLVQVGPPREFIGKSLRDLNLRAKYNVHIIAIKELVPENFILVPPPGFLIKDSDILIMLGKSEDISRIKALK